MVFPLIPLAVGGLAVSGAANVYRGVNSARIYDQFAKGYSALDRGYRSYLARNGRKINPDRALTSYYGQYLRSKVQGENSLVGAVGSASGTFGAASAMKTSRWL